MGCGGNVLAGLDTCYPDGIVDVFSSDIAAVLKRFW
jgi:hypothetical protein